MNDTTSNEPRQSKIGNKIGNKTGPREASPGVTTSSETLATEIHPHDERVLVFAPYGREAQLVCRLLEQEGLGVAACPNTDEFQHELTRGAGVALLTEEALTKGTLGRLEGFLSAQPAWSDLPLLLFVDRADATAHSFSAAQTLRERWSVTVLERPVRSATLTSLTHTALRARRRQYQLRALLAELGERVEARTEELTASNAHLRREMAERETAEAQQRQLEERFTKVFFASPLPITISTLVEGRFVDINDSALELLGFERDEVIGHTETDLGQWQHTSAGTRRKLLSRLAESGSLRDREITFRTKGGELRDGLAAYETLELDGRPCLLTMFVDITERKRTETQLKQAIEKTMQNAAWFSHQVMDELARLRTDKPESSELTELTNRERQVLELIAAGKSNDEISAELGLVTQTVRNYTANVYAKLGVHSRAEAVIWARERGLVKL